MVELSGFEPLIQCSNPHAQCLLAKQLIYKGKSFFMLLLNFMEMLPFCCQKKNVEH